MRRARTHAQVHGRPRLGCGRAFRSQPAPRQRTLVVAGFGLSRRGHSATHGCACTARARSCSPVDGNQRVWHCGRTAGQRSRMTCQTESVGWAMCPPRNTTLKGVPPRRARGWATWPSRGAAPIIGTNGSRTVAIGKSVDWAPRPSNGAADKVSWHGSHWARQCAPIGSTASDDFLVWGPVGWELRSLSGADIAEFIQLGWAVQPHSGTPPSDAISREPVGWTLRPRGDTTLRASQARKSLTWTPSSDTRYHVAAPSSQAHGDSMDHIV